MLQESFIFYEHGSGTLQKAVLLLKAITNPVLSVAATVL